MRGTNLAPQGGRRRRLHESGGRGGSSSEFVGPQVKSVLGGVSIYELSPDSLYRAILTPTHNDVRVGKPDNTLDRLFMGKIFTLGCKKRG